MKYYLTSLHFLLNVSMDDCIYRFDISREVEKPRNLHLSTKQLIFMLIDETYEVVSTCIQIIHHNTWSYIKIRQNIILLLWQLVVYSIRHPTQSTQSIILLESYSWVHGLPRYKQAAVDFSATEKSRCGSCRRHCVECCLILR